MKIQFVRSDSNATGLVEIEGEITIFSNEDYTVEQNEFRSIKTGIHLSIPDGSNGVLMETQPMGNAGINICGKLVTPLDLSELRVGVYNGSRTGFPVKKGSPIARLILVEASSETLQELTQEDLPTMDGEPKLTPMDYWAKMSKEKLDNRKEQLKLHEVPTGPRKLQEPIKVENPGLKAKTETKDAAGVDNVNVKKNEALKAP